MHILLTCAYIAAFVFIIRKWSFFKSDGIPASWPTYLFLLKIVAGIILGLIYTYHYTDIKTTDTFKFFNDSAILYQSFQSHPYDFFRMFTGIDADAEELRSYYVQMNAWLNTNLLFNDNRTIIRLNAFFHFFSLGFYYIHVVFLNFLSFIGLFCLYKVFEKECPERKRTFDLYFLLPSTLFWGSGLLKDGLLLFGMGVFVYHYYNYVKNPDQHRRLIPLILSIGLLSITKFYIIILLAPGLLTWWIIRKFKLPRPALCIISAYLLFFTVAFNFYRILPEYNLAAMLYWKQFNFFGYANAVESKSLIEIPRLGLDTWSVLKNAPQAFCTTYFRPFFNDIKGNPLVLLSVLENCILFFITILTIINFKKPVLKDKGIIWAAVLFILTLYILIGLTTPVLGAIVRYKIPALPFIGFVLISFSGKSKIFTNIEK
ncbi:MAG: hypothetical protein IPL24_18875 [Bacteroidetes bacterium]|nr:hypothetical protein [Bacteroidota bacterium]